LETSLYLHLQPEAVDMSQAVDEHGYTETEHAWMDWSDGPLKIMPWWSSFSESGVQGDASKATSAKGKALFEAATQEISAFVTELRSLPIPKRKDHH
jgi:creatinine amidohydrolase